MRRPIVERARARAADAYVRLRELLRVRDRIAIERDLRALRAENAFLAERAGSREGPVVLVIDPFGFVANIKLEGMLAKGLEAHGARPVVLTHSRLSHAHRYFDAFGFGERIFFDEYLDRVPERLVRDAVDDALYNGLDFQSIKSFRFRSVDVGRQALATFLRASHQGRLDFGDSATVERVRRLLVVGVRAVFAAEAVLDDVNPDVALINDAMYVGVGAVFEEALTRGMPVVQWVGSQRDDALVFKRFDEQTRRQHPFSLAPETWAAVRAEPWTETREAELRRDYEERYVDARWTSFYNRPYGAMQGADELRDALGIAPGRNVATVFSHILWDSTLFWGEDLFADYEEWLVETVRAATANDAVDWLVKLHPANVWKLRRDRMEGLPTEAELLRRHLGALPPHVRVIESGANVNTFALFAITDWCLTVRGTVGIEIAPFGVPVLTAGTGRYSGLGFTVDSSSRDEYLERLAHIQDVAPLTQEQVLLAKRYAHALFVRRPARFASFHTVYGSLADVGHPLDHNVVVDVRSSAELRAATDLRRFADWTLGSTDPDFLLGRDEGHED